MPAVIERDANPGDALIRAGRTLDAFRKDIEFVAAHREELTKKYPDEWVAVLGEVVKVHSRQRRELTRLLKAHGLLNKSPVIQFLTVKPMTLIL